MADNKKPPNNSMKIVLKGGKRYKLCTCGHSDKMPFCDNNHRELNKENNTNYKSVKIWPDKDLEMEVYSKMWKKKD